MNKIYSKVWNKKRGQIVVASELASSDSGGGGAGGHGRTGSIRSGNAVAMGSVPPFRRHGLAVLSATLVGVGMLGLSGMASAQDTSCFITVSNPGWGDQTTDGVTQYGDTCASNGGIFIESNTNTALGGSQPEGIVLRTRGANSSTPQAVVNLFQGYATANSASTVIRIGDSTLVSNGADVGNTFSVFTDRIAMGSVGTNPCRSTTVSSTPGIDNGMGSSRKCNCKGAGGSP